MKKSSITNALLFPFFLLLFIGPLGAQQQSSKSKSSDKLYEKGEILRNIKLENAHGVNSPKLEFSPAFYENGIVFVSLHKNGPIDPNTGKPFFELFYAEFDAQGLPQKPRDFSLSINSQAHEGPVSFSRDGNLLYFTRNSLESGIAKPNTRGQVPMKIYEARRGKYDWEGIQEMSFNSNEYTCFHPTLSADGNRLFFASDMPGGYGGYDLYFVEKRADTWSKPVNLGVQINTPDNEVFPFLHESGTLFFASNGHEGNGGLDIFMVDISDSKWGDVTNLGTPYNSAMDDLGFILNPEATRGYLASDRPGGKGDDDIYAFESAIPIIRNERVTLDAQVIAFDARTNERLGNASVRVFRRTPDGFIEGSNMYDVDMTPSENGDIVMRLKRKNLDDLGEANIFTNARGEANFEMVQGDNYFVLVDRDGYESEEVLHSTTERMGAQLIRVPMRSKSCTSLDGLVSINGYRNGVPNAVVRIVNMGTGQEETLYSNSSGQFDYCLARGYDYTVFAEKEGYVSGSTAVSTKSGNASELEVTVRLQPPSNPNETEEIVSEPIRTGSVIVLENIYYDFDQYFIRRGAATELDALAQLMKQYPSMEIQLIAHTDSRGEEKYNLDLSVKRADSAKRYLVAKGIDASRIEAFGYGEQEIRNHCTNGVNCDDGQHQFNRRTEVKVLRIDEPVQVEYEMGNPTGND